MKLEEKIKIVLPHHSELEKQFQRDLQDYKVIYKPFPDNWEFIKNNSKHTIWYYREKDSKVITETSKPYKEEIWLNVFLVLLLGVILLLEKREHINDDIPWFLIFIFLFSIGNWLVYRFKPEYKFELEKDHSQMVEYLRRFQK